jgi:hypothetical protein
MQHKCNRHEAWDPHTGRMLGNNTSHQCFKWRRAFKDGSSTWQLNRKGGALHCTTRRGGALHSTTRSLG